MRILGKSVNLQDRVAGHPERGQFISNIVLVTDDNGGNRKVYGIGRKPMREADWLKIHRETHADRVHNVSEKTAALIRGWNKEQQ